MSIGESTIMEADEILAQAKASPEAPHGWIVLPLSRRNLTIGILGWIFGIFLGLGLFVGIAFIVIPANYQHGIGPAIFSTILLAILLFIGLGSLWTLIVDVQRLRHADRHLIVITPRDFVKQEGNKVIHVPLAHVRYVTARGKAPPDRTPGRESQLRQIPGAGEGIAGFFFGRGIVPSGASQRRRRMRTPTSLAFIDTRNESEVTVVTDEAYGDPFMIAALLKEYAAKAHEIA
jgi:hypothetical protein